MKLRWLGQEVSPRQRAEAVVDSCLDSTMKLDVSTAAARERAFAQGARCSADAYCATFAVPPGICSSIAGPVAEAIADLWSSIFGSDPSIDCSKVSTFDPCHDCKLLAVCTQRNPMLPGFPNYIQQQQRISNIARCINETRRSCYETERKRIAAETVAVAERAAVNAQKRQTRVMGGVIVAGAAAGAAWYFSPAVRALARRAVRMVGL